MQTTSFNKRVGAALLRKDASLADLTAAAQSARAAFERAKINRAGPKALAAAESEAIYRERLAANGRAADARASKISLSPGAGASSRVITHAGVNTDIARLTIAAKSALVEFARATATGNPSGIRAARAELVNLQHQLETAQVDAPRTAATAAMLRTPMTLSL